MNSFVRWPVATSTVYTSRTGRPEIASALRGATSQGTRHSDSLKADLLYTAVPIVTKDDMRRDPVPALAKLGIVFQQPTLDLELSLTGNLLFHAGLQGLARLGEKSRI